eukprot:TRINITY_DN109_c0_g2_i1.p1 TRINITY_DN109_c0_g2~~TRINITY_DN109_c0_g2_i1.p1  ORF type:complete len:597 (-),score=178.71 TRINITY_DN109_c0_g2_i1:125-1915(-)
MSGKGSVRVPMDPASIPRSEVKSSFDLLFLKRLFKILRLISRSFVTNGTLLFLTALSIFQIYVVSLTGSVIGGFYTTISSKDKNAFLTVMFHASMVIVLSAILDSTTKFLVEILAWRWRKSLCLYVQERYFLRGLYYKLNMIDSHIDNPDQRITQDVDNFSTSLAQVISSFITAPSIVVWYTWKTWKTIGWYAPLIVGGYFVIGYIITKFIMSPIVRLVFQQEKLEGDFRFGHVRVRTSAESIALFDGGDREKAFSEMTFERLLKNKLSIIWRQWSLNTTSNTFTYFGSILNYFVVSLPIFFIASENANASPAYVAMASFYCISLIGGYSQFLNIATFLSDLAGFTARVSDMIETLSRLDGFQVENVFQVEPQVQLENEVESQTCIKFDDVTCYTPAGTCLASNLKFQVEQGENLLIMGPPGSGKTSILRILNGIWPYFSGKIFKPDFTIFYLPQKPYLFPGTFSEQIIYPEMGAADFDRIDFICQEMGIEDISKRYEKDQIINWADELSPGQQQLISFARLFYNEPKFAVLDEATSSLSEECERDVHEICNRLNITLVSVGHRSSLRPYYDRLLKLKEEHRWEFLQLDRDLDKQD